MGTAAVNAGSAGSAIYASLATAAASGWCVFLGKSAGSPLTAADADAMYRHVAGEIDRQGGIQFLNPLWHLVANGAKTAIRNRLTEWVAQGATCDSIPANLATDPTIDSAIPDSPGEVIGPTLQAIIDFTGLGDILIRLGVLVAILALILMAIRRVIR